MFLQRPLSKCYTSAPTEVVWISLLSSPPASFINIFSYSCLPEIDIKTVPCLCFSKTENPTVHVPGDGRDFKNSNFDCQKIMTLCAWSRRYLIIFSRWASFKTQDLVLYGLIDRSTAFCNLLPLASKVHLFIWSRKTLATSYVGEVQKMVDAGMHVPGRESFSLPICSVQRPKSYHFRDNDSLSWLLSVLYARVWAF